MKPACLAVALLAAANAHASQWFPLDSRAPGTPSTVVEVDLSTVRLGGGAGEAVVRVTHESAQPHPNGYAYRSFIATAQFDCQRQSVSLVSAAYFTGASGQGTRLGADSTGRASGMPARLQDSIPPHARQALLRAACTN